MTVAIPNFYIHQISLRVVRDIFYMYMYNVYTICMAYLNSGNKYILVNFCFYLS